MNTRHFRRIALAVSAAAVLPLALTACSGDSDTSTSGSDASSAKASSSSAPAEETMPMDQPFGPACSTVPKDGAGSFDGMAKDPVATAASHNPALSTLVTAVKQAGLVDTLNNAQDITVFAPTNDAFAKIPKADLDKLLADKAQLTKVLTSHVVGQKLTPKQLEKGSFDTLAKTKLTTSGSDMTYTVNDSAKVVCGNVQTANATVYIIDTVLMPMN
ncbi:MULTISPECIES: fasciclin domain-containing protein [unclassified Streptomyces]|uniref:fasciclin domain-containing protein n=1 Tax=unclassified Streptomyces TaxID=2593676 RepID=UPI0001C1BB15|nr:MULTISPECIES: fasciclin domain-containing protein [unclassified Streptomyces]AEN08983.1 beta-Ig-H3/fasciclin [Streptomyces sp. SirexAA-E]MYR69021.1 fasciclin domain-containing protein [Streptomyces sp. SID4939]MYS02746.1 fasciclin domain-containing protein [Streptomyces sp. SID4940]MYT62645.1 fasciclin domain-containing protein [Streptomyces sp. SID8357]MYT86212.1 fasciclin domain-containing protein [Streptomyces sp. SID8360]